eukprot:TRINITY_DN82686_c0_g1_i1.p1 TRINITY_DN82686_c0_g1~~TRINITY_DN82686_c0_g1_i1.p1  ORF type:complete len:379 (-),score=70.60 TRINITY_DN82686_c0_g1_i1:47-1183(-)
MSSLLFVVASVVMLGIVLLLMSVDQVEQNEYGLVFNWVTKTIGSDVYHGGTHFVGFWNAFVTFPATVQTIEFSTRVGLRTAEALHTRTKEGLGLHLSIAFQYKLNPDEIPQLYALTNKMYESLFTRIARDQLLEAASEYEGPQYWLEREHIGEHMRRLVDSQLASSHAALWSLQLLGIDLPDQYEDSITNTQVQQQMVKTRRNEQVAAGIRADTEVLRAQYAKQVQVVRAGASANATVVEQLAKAEAAKRRIAAEAGVLGYAREKMKMSAAGIVEYQQLGAYSNLENATFLANVLGATPVVAINGAPAQPAGAVKLAQASSHEVEEDEEEDRSSTSVPEEGAAKGSETQATTKRVAKAKIAGDSPGAQAFLGFFGSSF